MYDGGETIIGSGIQHFYLMNKNDTIGNIAVNSSNISIADCVILAPSYINNVNTWLNTRFTPVARNEIGKTLKENGIHNVSDFLSVTGAISLTDTFWVLAMGQSTSWEEINEYSNNNNIWYANYTLDGTANKCWRGVKDGIYLYKTDTEKWSGITGNRPYSEYYACQLAKQLGLRNYTKYSIKVNKTKENLNKAYCKCKSFTDIDNSFIPISDTIYRNLTVQELDKIMFNSTESRVTLREMLLLDCLDMNYDRHTGNFGFIYNSNSYKIKRLAPIFDNDFAFGPNISLQNKSIEQAYDELKRYKSPRTVIGNGTFIEQGKWALTDELISNMKNMYPFKINRLNKEIDIEDKRIDFMEYIVNK